MARASAVRFSLLIGAIVGGVLGCVVLAVVAGVGIYCFWKHRRRQNAVTSVSSGSSDKEAVTASEYGRLGIGSCECLM
jgi:heme/copper-type cytochrome/quinol oxidase subunit 2